MLARSGGTWTDTQVRAVLATPYQVGARMADGALVKGGNIEPLVPDDVYEQTLLAMSTRRGAPQPGGVPRGPGPPAQAPRGGEPEARGGYQAIGERGDGGTDAGGAFELG